MLRDDLEIEQQPWTGTVPHSSGTESVCVSADPDRASPGLTREFRGRQQRLARRRILAGPSRSFREATNSVYEIDHHGRQLLERARVGVGGQPLSLPRIVELGVSTRRDVRTCVTAAAQTTRPGCCGRAGGDLPLPPLLSHRLLEPESRTGGPVTVSRRVRNKLRKRTKRHASAPRGARPSIGCRMLRAHAR